MLIYVHQVSNPFVVSWENVRLLFDLEIENDFKRKIQEHVAKIDSEKAALLAQLEKELNARQELILESARKRIDDLNEEANRLKMVCLYIHLHSFSYEIFCRMFFEKLKLKAILKSVSILSFSIELPINRSIK